MVERPSNRALIVVGNESSQLPALIANVGPEGTKRFFEFFTVPIRNAHTLGLPASHRRTQSRGRSEGELWTSTRAVPGSNVLEQDHRAIKRRAPASPGTVQEVLGHVRK